VFDDVPELGIAYPSTQPELRTIKAVEVFRVGEWNGDDYTREDLQTMVDAFNQVGYPVPIKFGHDEASGMPAVGWVDRIYIIGEVLYADFKDLSPWVFSEIVEYHSYDAVSIEIYFNLKRDGKTFKRALKAVALLGAETPAVSGLAPLREAVFAADTFEKIASCSLQVAPDMPDPVKKIEVDAETVAKLTAAEQTIAQLKAKGEEDAKAIAAMKAANDATNSQVATLLAQSAKRDLDARVAKCQVPALVGHFTAIYDAIAGSTTVAKFKTQTKGADGKAVEATVEKPIADVIDDLVAHVNKLTANATQSLTHGRSIPVKQDDDNGQTYANPSQELAARVKEYRAAEPKASYEAATKAVLSKDGELAQRVLAFTNSGAH
jgi:hypothetical protein